MNISDNIKEILQQKAEAQKNIQSRRYDEIYYYKDIEYNDFEELMKINMQYVLMQAGRGEVPIVVNDEIRTILEYLWKWETMNNCKGLLLSGGVGIGKTTILMAFMNYRNNLADYLNENDELRRSAKRNAAQKMISISATKVNNLTDLELKFYTQAKLLLIDEIGREQSEKKDFGTIKTPMASMLFGRNEMLQVTFATTNKTKKELIDIYGEALFDRMFEMFNFIVCPDSLKTFRRNDDYQLQSQLKNKPIN